MSGVQIVAQMLDDAFESQASDIHLESEPSGILIRFRVDGLLFDRAVIDKEISHQVLARVKVLSRLDVAEKRIPQDGKFSITKDGVEIDLRVATFPALYGEKIVIRILKKSSATKTLDSLGFTPELHQNLLNLIHRSTGFFLITGPTGSGKTTTLYAILRLLKSPEKNIVTLEDPIEYNIEGITQGQVIPEIGFTFARGMRALLRGDPEIIMVGEIRDKETAEVAIQAALTGHFVLSSCHTNDAPGAVMRLIDMGIPQFLINATVSAVLAQRLVRVLCEDCKYHAPLDEKEREFAKHINIQVNTSFKSAGCSRCDGRGYKGRTGIFELMIMNQELRDLVGHAPSYDKIACQALKNGMVSLRIDAAQKINEGITSIAELARAIW